MSSIKYLLVMLFSIAVVACGGGGGSSSPAPTYSISGTVSGNATSGVTITLSGTSTATTTTTTAAGGTYSFAGLANGSYTVTPSLASNSFSPTSTAVTVSGANVTGKNFTATAAATTYTISGSAGIAGATITLGGANTGSVTAGSGGAYTISGLVAGGYTVTPSLTGYTFLPTNASVTITNANATATTFVPTANPVAHTLSGNVSPSLSGVTITVTGGTTNPSPTTTDASGNYSFTGATGLYDGTYTVTPTKTGYTFALNSASVTMAGVNMTQNFTGTANTAVTATANGTVTGAWKQGVTITLSGGGQSGTTTTNASGSYSFANLPSAQTYTFTPTLAGYNFGTAPPTATVLAGISTAVTVPAITATSAIASNSISGTVTYTGTHTGPVSVLAYQTGCTSCSSQGGTLINLTGTSGNYSGTYTIRGIQHGTYNIVAGMDALGTGLANSADPVGTATATNTAGAVANANIILTDPTVLAPAAPSIQSVSPGSGTAFIQYNPPLDPNGLENATSYTVSWGTDAATATVGGSSATFAANGTNNSFAFVHSLTNSSVLYFKLTATNTAGTSAASAVSGPMTIGAVGGANTVTGTVNFTGTASGPLIVLAHTNGSGRAYYAIVGSQASPPVSGASYTITGVPAGTYQLAVVIDNNNNWLVDAGDFTYGFQGNAPAFSVSASTPAQNVTMSTASATAFVQTSYYSSGGGGYSLNAGASDGNKHVVNVILISGPNVAVPLDMGIDPNNNSTNVNLNGFTPVVNDDYGFLVTYSDGSSQIISGKVTGVLTSSNLAQSLAVSTASGVYTPTFSWTAPATLPTATPFIYRLQNLGTNGIEVPSGTTSVNLATKGVVLTTGTYNWQVEVRDANSNTAQVQATTPYTAP